MPLRMVIGDGMSEIPLILVPDADEPDGAEIYVDGTIASRPYRFLLDTGAAKTSLLTDDYLAGFAAIDTHHSSGVFAPSREDLITVPSIEVGAISKQNITVVRSSAQSARQISLIGMDVLKDYRLHFRFDQNRVLVDEDVQPDYPLQALTMDQRFHPYVDVQFEGVCGQAVWDTGASITIVDLTFAKDHPALFEEVGQSTGTDSTGVQMQTPLLRVAASRIGDCEFAPFKAAAVDLSAANATIEIPMNLILGYTALRQANWYFDFPRRQWAIARCLTL